MTVSMSNPAISAAAPNPAPNPAAAPAPAPGANAATTNADLLDPDLIPTILPRILAIAQRLQQLGEEDVNAVTASTTNGNSQHANGPPVNTSNGQDSKAAASGPAQVGRPTTTSANTDGPSIALGQISDDDPGLYDFLFSSSSSSSSLFANDLLSDASGLAKSEAARELLRETRQLRDVYRAAMKSVGEMDGGERSIEEQVELMAALRQYREELLQDSQSFSASADRLRHPT